MKRLAPSMIAATALLGIVAATPAAPPAGARPTEGARLEGGTRSVPELVASFLHAVREKDLRALRNLRVTEKEYREIILPGSVGPGESPRRYAPEFVDFLWGSLDTRNAHGERGLVSAYGEKPLVLRHTSFTGGERTFAGYTSHGRLDLTLTDGHGNELSLEMGSVAQVGGRYKFISFVRD